MTKLQKKRSRAVVGISYKVGRADVDGRLDDKWNNLLRCTPQSHCRRD